MAIARPVNCQRAWAKAIAQPASEFPLTPLPIIAGQIPPGLRGTLYRNGPGRLERGSDRVGHWFDGDGAVLAVHFSEAGATGVYRYVQTSGYEAEEKAGRYLFGGYGMMAPGPFWQRWGKAVKNAANTSILPLPDRLLALWEGGEPHALNLQNLETLGLDAPGVLAEGKPYSAHPKSDPRTREIFNFGVTPGLNATLHLYKSHPKQGDRPGDITQTATIPLQGMPLIHDFVLAGPYLIFCVPPVRINLLRAGLGLSSFSDAMSWQPALGTEILIVDRDTLGLLSRASVDPWFQWHFSNGYVDADGFVVVDVIRYADFQTNQRLKEIATGTTQTAAEGKLWQIRLDPLSGKVQSQQPLIDRSCEFPVVAPHQVGQAARFTYLSMHTPNADITTELYGAIARYDRQTESWQETNLGQNRYPSEPIYAEDAVDRQKGWILSVVFDGHQQTSEVWIFASDRLDEAPICRLGLPSIIPLSFHGAWHPA